MQSLQHLVVDLGRRGDRRVLVTAVLAVKAAWLVILAVVGAAFLRVAGVPLLDLQNLVTPGEMITPPRGLAQIAAYPEEARTLYWSFLVPVRIVGHLDHLLAIKITLR